MLWTEFFYGLTFAANVTWGVYQIHFKDNPLGLFNVFVAAFALFGYLFYLHPVGGR